MTEAVTGAAQSETLKIRRYFEAKPENLYRYFTEGEHLARWFGPKGVVCRDVTVDATIGGNYAITMINSDGSEIGLVGQFVELDPPTRIQMTWRWLRDGEGHGTEDGEETLVTIQFRRDGDGTLLHLTHERFAEPSERDRHDNGWESTLDCLDEFLAGEHG